MINKIYTAYGNTPQIETGQIFSARNHCIGNHLSIRQCGNQEKPSGHPRDYAAIAKEGVIDVATEYNSISFYVDGDTVSGFHYELIQAFAHDKGLKTEITPLMSFEERLEGLSEGRYDVIACGILATSELKDSLLLTSPITLNKQVLVQRKENGENDSLYIRSQLDLAGRTLHVVKGLLLFCVFRI